MTLLSGWDIHKQAKKQYHSNSFLAIQKTIEHIQMQYQDAEACDIPRMMKLLREAKRHKAVQTNILFPAFMSILLSMFQIIFLLIFNKTIGIETIQSDTKQMLVLFVIYLFYVVVLIIPLLFILLKGFIFFGRRYIWEDYTLFIVDREAEIIENRLKQLTEKQTPDENPTPFGE